MIILYLIITLVCAGILVDLVLGSSIGWVLLTYNRGEPYVGISPGSTRELDHYCHWLDHHGIKWRILVDDELGFTGMTHLLLTGGADVGKSSDRDMRDIYRYANAINNDIPIIGICRGMQLAALLGGGSLYEHLLDAGYHGHSSIEEGPISQRNSSWHQVTFKRFHWIPFGISYRVNSRHHQGVFGTGDWIPFAWSSDGLVEAMGDSRSLFVQWHPELPDLRYHPSSKIVADWIKCTVHV